MTSQCVQCTSKIHTIKKTGILTIVLLCRYNNCNIGAETRISGITVTVNCGLSYSAWIDVPGCEGHLSSGSLSHGGP